MTKLSEKIIKIMLEDWAVNVRNVAAAQAERDAALRPVYERHAAELLDAAAKFNKRIAKFSEAAGQLEIEINQWLKAQSEDVLVSTANAVAERLTETKTGARVIDPKRFLDVAKSKGEALWECVTIAVAKAEKLLGKTEIDAISEKKETVRTVMRVRVK